MYFANLVKFGWWPRKYNQCNKTLAARHINVRWNVMTEKETQMLLAEVSSHIVRKILMDQLMFLLTPEVQEKVYVFKYMYSVPQK